jgi:hypothetical protein
MKLFKELAQIKEKQLGRMKDIAGMGPTGPTSGSSSIEEEAARELQAATSGATQGAPPPPQHDADLEAVADPGPDTALDPGPEPVADPDAEPDPSRHPSVLRRIPQGWGGGRED